MAIPGLGTQPGEVRFSPEILDQHQAYIAQRQTLMDDRSVSIAEDHAHGIHFIVQSRDRADAETAENAANSLNNELRGFNRDHPIEYTEEAINATRETVTTGVTGINFAVAGVRLFQDSRRSDVIDGVAASTTGSRVDMFRSKGFFKKYLVHEPIITPPASVRGYDRFLSGDPDSMDNLMTKEFKMRPGDRMTITSEYIVADGDFIRKLSQANLVGDNRTPTRTPQDYVNFLASDARMQDRTGHHDEPPAGELFDARGGAAIYIEYQRKKGKVAGLLAKVGLGGAGVKKPKEPKEQPPEGAAGDGTPQSEKFTDRARARGLVGIAAVAGYFTGRNGGKANPFRFISKERREARRAERAQRRSERYANPSTVGFKGYVAERRRRHEDRKGAGNYGRIDRINAGILIGLAAAGGRGEKYHRNHWNDERYRGIADEQARHEAIEERRVRKGALLVGGAIGAYVIGSALKYYHMDVVPTHLRIQWTPWTPPVDYGDGDAVDLGPWHGKTPYQSVPGNRVNDGWWGGVWDDDPAKPVATVRPGTNNSLGEFFDQLDRAARAAAEKARQEAENNRGNGAPINPDVMSVHGTNLYNTTLEGNVHLLGHAQVGDVRFDGADSHEVVSELRKEFGDDLATINGQRATFTQPNGDLWVIGDGPLVWRTQAIQSRVHELIAQYQS